MSKFAKTAAKTALFISSCLLFGFRASAGISVGLSGLYISDEFTTATTASNSKTLINGNLLFSIDNKERFYTGFHAHQMTFEETSVSGSTTTKNSLTSLDMGPYVLAYIDRKKIFSLGLGYNLLVNGTYTHGTVNETLTGTSLMGSLSASPEIGKELYLGFDLNYIKVDYVKSTVSSTTSDVSYSRTFILPTISILWRN